MVKKEILHYCLIVFAAAITGTACFAIENLYKKKTLQISIKHRLVSEVHKTKADTKRVDQTSIPTPPYVAVTDFTIDKSVESKMSGSAIAIKLEQSLANKFRIVTRSQLTKVLQELRFQASDLVDKNKAQRFGKLAGIKFLISGSVIQLGREITIACQIINIETGEIIQTAEISGNNVNDFNHIIHNATKILSMTDAEKAEYICRKNANLH